MWFFEISSVSSICMKTWKCEWEKWRKSQFYCAFSYDVGEMISPFVSNFVVGKFEFFSRL
jgi:hypothetical protein